MTSNDPVEIIVCMGSSCFSRGNSENLAAIRDYLKTRGIENRVRLAGSRCEGECMNGPNIRVNGKLITGVEPARVPDILDKELAGGEGNG